MGIRDFLVRGVSEFETTLNAIHTKIHAIQPPIHPRQPFLNGGHTDFQIMHIVNDSVHLAVDAAQHVQD
jgi:hypothetical protein